MASERAGRTLTSQTLRLSKPELMASVSSGLAASSAAWADVEGPSRSNGMSGSSMIA